MMQDAQTLLYDRYSVLHIERTNSFNKVFFVLDTYQSPPRSCVIKIFQPIVDKFQIIQWIDREFQREANRLKQISLSNIHLPEIYTYSNNSHNYYLVRELIEGKTLQEEVEARGRFSIEEAKDILTKLLSVLSYIHQQGVIHQNIKPKNIILRQEDRVPMLINFGSIKQIVATYGFYGDKQIFSGSNIYGYAPSEQALGRSVPATDLYSLGLTAIYLLTGENPVDLPTESNSSHFKIPSSIANLDLNLAKVLERAISPNIGARYSSASEMFDDLFQGNSNSQEQKPLEPQVKSIASVPEPKKSPRESNWWKTIIYVMGSVYILGTVIIIWYDWNLNRNAFVPELPEPSTSLSPPLAAPKTVTKKQSILNSQSKNLIEVPIFPTGTSKAELRKALGEPNAIQKGYWGNSSAWIYKDRANNSIDMGYLFDLDTDRLRQTEVAIAPSVGLSTINDILNSLLQGKINPSVSQALQQVYQRQENEYLFKLEDLEVSIEREEDDHIYLGVWEAGFH